MAAIMVSQFRLWELLLNLKKDILMGYLSGLIIKKLSTDPYL